VVQDLGYKVQGLRLRGRGLGLTSELKLWFEI
jgi:hypothetical protein